MRALIMASLLIAQGCGRTAVMKPPKPVDEVASLRQAARQLDHAIAATKRMIQRSRGAEYIADTHMRLAELYTERARYAWLIAYEAAQARGETSRTVVSPEARLYKELAIAVYDRVMREFPRYRRVDSALFFMAHEYREAGEFDAMKQAYERLIATYPKSQHRLEAYLVLGDSEFDKGSLVRAERYYNLILAQPSSHVHPLARYKLAWVRINQENCKGAVKLLEMILRDEDTPRGERTIVRTQRSLNIRREALVDLAYCYPEVFPDQPATPYFRELAAGSTDYLAAMTRVGNRFSVKQMYAQAAAAQREILGAAPADPGSVEAARKLYDAVTRAKLFDAAAADVALLGRVAEARRFDVNMAKDAAARLEEELEISARDLATKAHLAAKEGVKPALYGNAADAYRSYLAYFRGSKFQADMRANLAGALGQAGRHFEAGLVYGEVAESTKDEARLEAWLNAIAAFQQALGADLSPRQRLRAWHGIRAAGEKAIAAKPDDARMLQVKFSVARSAYEAGDYRRAAELFYAVSRQYPQAPEAVAGAHLALDALLLAEDFDGLATMGRRLLANERLGDATFRGEVADIVAKTEQRKVTELTLTSGSRGGEELLALAKKHKGSGMGEKALHNALVVARESGDIEKFYELGEMFVTEYPQSSQRTEVLTALGNMAVARVDFRQAAAFLEAAYKANPSAKEAKARLRTAAAIRAALGDGQAASTIKELAAIDGDGQGELDASLWALASAGNFAAVEEIVGDGSADGLVGGPVAGLLAGAAALERGDLDGATARLSRLEKAGDSELQAQARFLLAEVALEEFAGYVGDSDLAKAVVEKSARFLRVDQAFAAAIQSRHPTWALAAMARLSEAYGGFAQFFRTITVPQGLSSAEEKQVRTALEAKATEAEARSAELRKKCGEKAQDVLVFSAVSRSCLLGEPLPKRLALVPHVGAAQGIDPPGASALRQALSKRPNDGPKLIALARLYLGSQDLATTLLILERVQEADAEDVEAWNLRGVALYRAGDGDGAYEAFTKALSLDPSNSRARLNLAAHLAHYGYKERAGRELDKVKGSRTALGDVAEHPELGAFLQGGKR